jgi:hypothetical protein
MDSRNVLDLCKEYARLGSSIGDQLDYLFECGGPQNMDPGHYNMNALAYIHEFCDRAAIMQAASDDDNDEFQCMKEELEEFAEENGGEFSYGRWKPSAASAIGTLGI